MNKCKTIRGFAVMLRHHGAINGSSSLSTEPGQVLCSMHHDLQLSSEATECFSMHELDTMHLVRHSRKSKLDARDVCCCTMRQVGAQFTHAYTETASQVQ